MEAASVKGNAGVPGGLSQSCLQPEKVTPLTVQTLDDLVSANSSPQIQQPSPDNLVLTLRKNLSSQKSREEVLTACHAWEEQHRQSEQHAGSEDVNFLKRLCDPSFDNNKDAETIVGLVVRQSVNDSFGFIEIWPTEPPEPREYNSIIPYLACVIALLGRPCRQLILPAVQTALAGESQDRKDRLKKLFYELPRERLEAKDFNAPNKEEDPLDKIGGVYEPYEPCGPVPI